LSARRRETKGLSYPKLGDKWYVFLDRKNVLMGHDTEDEARAAAAKHFDRKRKRQI
jgi:hypothetical protein